MDEYVNGKHCFDSDLLRVLGGLRRLIALVTALVHTFLMRLGIFTGCQAGKVVVNDDTFVNRVVICLRDFDQLILLGQRRLNDVREGGVACQVDALLGLNILI